MDESSIIALSRKPVEGLYDDEGDYIATDRIPIWVDGEGLTAGTKRILYIIDVDSGKTEILAEDKEDIYGFTIYERDIYYFTPIDWRKPHINKLVKQGVNRKKTVILEGYNISQVRAGPKGVYALMHKNEIGIASHYKLYALGDEETCISCGLDRNIDSIAGFRGENPVIIYKDRGSRILAEAGSEGLQVIDGDNSYIHEADAWGGVVAYVKSDPTTPPELYVDRSGSKYKATRVNEWLKKEVKLSEPRHFKVDADGEEVDAWILLPLKGDPPYPAILYIHGGPKGMYGYYFHPEMQLMAAEGFAVIYANPRGSDGYSEEFADIRGRYGEDDFTQLMKVLDRAVELYNIDHRRLGVTGISYGGFLTNYIVTKTNRFKAAVSENGIADWIADFWASDIGYWFDPDQIGGTPHDNLEGYVEKSPAFHTENVETPILLIHSMEDYRCFIDQALAMHASLSLRGKESRLVVFTRGSHGHSLYGDPRHRGKRFRIKLEWFKSKLR